MPTHIRFRLNKLTGEVEEFLIDDQDQSLPEAEHDRIATEVGRVVARRPLIHEVHPNTIPVAESQRDQSPDDTGQSVPEIQRQGGGTL